MQYRYTVYCVIGHFLCMDALTRWWCLFFLATLIHCIDAKMIQICPVLLNNGLIEPEIEKATTGTIPEGWQIYIVSQHLVYRKQSEVGVTQSLSMIQLSHWVVLLACATWAEGSTTNPRGHHIPSACLLMCVTVTAVMTKTSQSALHAGLPHSAAHTHSTLPPTCTPLRHHVTLYDLILS